MNRSRSVTRHTLAAVAAMSCTAAHAHVPYFEDPDFTGDAPFVIDDVEQSKAIYAWLENKNDVDPYRLNVTEPVLLYVKVIIPLCRELVDFRPTFAIKGPGMGRPLPENLPFEPGAEQGVAIRRDNSPAGLDRPSNYEFFSDQFYWEGPIFRLEVDEPGDYTVYFWDERGATGDYVAVIGKQERFSISDMQQSAVNTLKIRDMEYLHGPCSEM